MKPLSLEKKAAITLITVLSIFLFSIYLIGKRNLWFEPTNTYYLELTNAEGLRIGSDVTISGLIAGQVTNISMNEERKIIVTFTVKKTLALQIRYDSPIKVVRSFVFGEKKIDIEPGTHKSQIIPDKTKVIGSHGFDLISLISKDTAGNIGAKIDRILNMADRFAQITEQLIEKADSKDIAKAQKLFLSSASHIHEASKNFSALTSGIN